MPDEEMVVIPCGMRQATTRLPHATQNGVQFKIYELFISGIVNLIFSD